MRLGWDATILLIIIVCSQALDFLIVPKVRIDFSLAGRLQSQVPNKHILPSLKYIDVLDI